MSEQANIQVIQDIYAAFGRGDVAHIASQLTDDVTWHTHMDPVVPWAGGYTKANLPKFFDGIFSSMEVTVFEPQEWVAQGDTVVSLGRFGGNVHKTGKSFVTRWAFVWKLRDGKVSSYEQFHDPAIADNFR